MMGPGVIRVRGGRYLREPEIGQLADRIEVGARSDRGTKNHQDAGERSDKSLVRQAQHVLQLLELLGRDERTLDAGGGGRAGALL
jgi:hypothetical protein